MGNLENWLRHDKLEARPPLTGQLLSGGRSNLTFLIKDAEGRAFCLRRPPLGAAGAANHNVLRESKILQCLSKAELPVPRVVATCEDASVIGAPFFLMTFLGGRAWGSAEDVRHVTENAKLRASESLPPLLARIHDIDLEETGLQQFSRSQRYLDRQLVLWRRQLETASDQFEDLLDLANQLKLSMPSPTETTLIHGDFKIGNCLFLETGELTGILDWELSTIGEPLSDVGWLMASWMEPSDVGDRIVPPATTAGGFLSRDKVAEIYGKLSNRPLADLNYYTAFAEWKWACIDVGILNRVRSGAMGNLDLDLSQVRREIGARAARSAALLND